jgi:tetratricopeptide (TPR) repeat protein
MAKAHIVRTSPLVYLLLIDFLLLSAVAARARDKADEWIEVRSPHFVVATNSSEKQGRRVADQFERMRSVFHVAFPKMQIDLGTPIIVLACKDDKSFRSLEPEAYLAKGSLKLGGLFLRGLDKNYVLLRLDAEGEHPYAVVYHEYTHLLMGKSAVWMPLWMNEGLAQFYENTDIHEKDVELGQPSGQLLMVLRQNRLLPLDVLFRVDEKSPYYHEENKGNIFYAESWALMHYLMVTDRKNSTDRVKDYADLLAQGADPVTAAATAFGDLKKLQVELDSYVNRNSYTYFKLATTTEVDDSAFQTQPLTATQSDAIRADFLAYNGRDADARALLERILADDPKNASAHETMGFLEFRGGHLEEAGKYYDEATQLDSQNYLAYYYAGAIAMNRGLAASEEQRVEANLRRAIKLNPDFAPTYDRLAALLGMGRRNLDEARMMELNAISMDPANVGYRLNMANILLEMNQWANAINVLKLAEKLAKTPAEVQAVENLLMNAQMFASAQEDRRAQMDAESDKVSAEEHTASMSAPLAKPDTFVAKGPHRFVTGTLKNVHCSRPQLDLTVESAGKSLALHAANSYEIEFSAVGFTPQGDLNPCTDLEGRPAKVEYVESADPAVAARVIRVELHK